MGAVDDPKGQPAGVVHVVEAVTDGERDQLKLYQKISNRLSRVGLSVPGVEIRWNNLVVEAKSVPPPGAGPARGPRYHRILDAGSGVLRPGRMVLLLGPPGAGRTTLLKALVGQLLPPPAHRSRPPSTKDGSGAARHGLRMYGSVHYNGMDMYGGEFEVARAATYVGQTESHLAELTVGETLTFAAECMGPSIAKRMYQVLREREAAAGISADQQDPDMDRLMAMMATANAPQLMVQGWSRGHAAATDGQLAQPQPGLGTGLGAAAAPIGLAIAAAHLARWPCGGGGIAGTRYSPHGTGLRGLRVLLPQSDLSAAAAA